MAATKKVTLRSTTIVPEEVAKLKGGQTLAKGTSVSLPEAYADHLVAERLADEAKSKNKGSTDDGSTDQSLEPNQLGDMSRDDLLAEAKRRSVNVPNSANKDEIIAAIQKAPKA